MLFQNKKIQVTLKFIADITKIVGKFFGELFICFLKVVLFFALMVGIIGISVYFDHPGQKPYHERFRRTR